MNRKTGIVLSAIIAIIAGLWVWAAVIPKDSIQIGGSTSVSNVMTNLEEAYKTYQEENNKDKKPDQFIYSSVGSSGGINSAVSGTYKMGFISKNLDNSRSDVTYVKPYTDNDKLLGESVSDRQKDIYQYFKDTKNNKDTKNTDMHYVQIATDAIIIVYKAPKWFTDKVTFDINLASPESKDIIKEIYEGHKKWSWVAEKFNYKPTEDDLKDDKEIQPFAGTAGSGTRTVFDNVFDLTNDTKAQEIPSVGPSDGFMFSSIKDNTIGYLSMNYLDQIKQHDDMHTVLINKVDAKKNLTVSNVNEYKLTRPYIGLIRAKSSDDDLEKMANFLGWIADAVKKDKPETKALDQYKSAGIAPEFKLDYEKLLPEGNDSKSAQKVEEHSSTTNSELKQNILNAYVRKD